MNAERKKRSYIAIVGCSQCRMKWLNDCDLSDVMEAYYAKDSNHSHGHEHIELHTKKKKKKREKTIGYVKSNRLPFAIRFGE